jgi:hypothetical protein
MTKIDAMQEGQSMAYNKILLFSMDKVPKFRQECRPKCRPIPKDYKTAETDTETDISAEISADTDTETDNFRSLLLTPRSRP